MITIDAPTLKRIEKDLAKIPGGAQKVINRAVSYALRRGRTEVVRAATANYLIKPGEVRASLTLQIERGQGAIESRSPNLPLNKFKISPPGPQQRRKHKRPIFATVRKGGGGEIAQGFVIGGAGVFERTTSARLPIKKFYTIGAAVMVGARGTHEEIERAMQLALDGEIDRQAALLLDGK
jgi:hypothetical protein